MIVQEWKISQVTFHTHMRVRAALLRIYVALVRSLWSISDVDLCNNLLHRILSSIKFGAIGKYYKSCNFYNLHK